MESLPFKTCPCCGHAWETREGFLDDPRLSLNGYQADMDELERGLFYFTHDAPGCGSTMTLFTKHFLDLYSGVRYPGRKTDTPECPGLCRDRNQLARCEALCECALAREVIQIIRQRHEAAVLAAASR